MNVVSSSCRAAARRQSGRDKAFSYNYYCKNDPDNAQWIRDGATKGRPVGGDSKLGQSLLRGSEGGGVGGGATHDADGVAYGDAEKQGYQHGHDSPYEYDAKPQQVEFQPSLAEGAEEAGADLKSELVDKQYESEVLRIVKNYGVDREAQMPGEDAGEKHERNAKGDPLDAQFP